MTRRWHRSCCPKVSAWPPSRILPSIEADEDELHIAFIAHELGMFDEPYETIDISGVYSVSNGNVDRI